MKISFNIKNKKVQADLSKPLDLSIPLSFKKCNINAWDQKAAIRSPVQMDNWIGDCNQGSSVNFFDISFISQVTFRGIYIYGKISLY